MAYRSKAQQSATETQNNTGGGGDYNDDWNGDFETIELSGDEARVRVHPGTFIAGTFPEDEGNPVIHFPDYNEDAKEVGAGGYIVLALDDPELIVDEDEETENTVVLDTEDDDSYDYRVYNTDRDGTEVIDGVGVEFDAGQGARIYKGDVIDADEFPTDERVTLSITGGGHTNVARRLDVKGIDALFDYETGEPNGGLIERPIYNEDGGREDIDGNSVDFNFRYARDDPEVKEELFGARIGLLMDWKQNMIDVEELSEEAREQYEEGRGQTYYYSLFNLDTGEEIEITDDGEPEQRSYLRWRYDTNRLPDAQYSFVQQYADEVGDPEEDTILSHIEEHESNFEEEADTDRIVELIQQRL